MYTTVQPWYPWEDCGETKFSGMSFEPPCPDPTIWDPTLPPDWCHRTLIDVNSGTDAVEAADHVADVDVDSGSDVMDGDVI